MARGDLTASALVHCSTSGAIKTAIDALNLSNLNTSGSDWIEILPTGNLNGGFWVFKVEVAAS